MRSIVPSRFARRSWLLAVLVLGLLVVPGVSPAGAAGPSAVYTQTNDPAGNQVVVFDRAADGTLTERGRVSTGGVGKSAPEAPILDSQGSVELSQDQKLLFVVNAGSNTVSSFKVRPGRLPKLVDQESSHGTFPLSVDSLANGPGRSVRSGLVYVLNEVSGNIFGYRYAANGRLTPIAGSSESLSIPGAAGRAAQIGFNGRILTVTLRGPAGTGPGSIDTFLLGADDRPGPAIAHPSNEGPFGFAYDSRDHLVVSDSFVNEASSYALHPNGALTHISTDGPTGIDPCWVVITPDGRFAFTTDAIGLGTDPPIGFGPGTISRFSLSDSGVLVQLGAPQTTGSPGLATDAALSHDGRFLYVIKVDPFVAGASHIDTLRVGSDGSLTYVGSTPSNLPLTTSGLAASGTPSARRGGSGASSSPARGSGAASDRRPAGGPPSDRGPKNR